MSEMLAKMIFALAQNKKREKRMKAEVLRSVAEIDPAVHFVGTVRVTPEDGAATRIGYVHRLFCLRGGACRIRIADVELSLRREDILILLSGTPYQILADEGGASLLSVNFSFFGGSEGAERPPFRYVVESDFREENRVERIRFSEGILRAGYATVRAASELGTLLNELLTEEQRGEILCQRQIRAYLLLCLNRIFRRLLISPSGEEPRRHEEILAYLTEHYAEPIDNRSIAAHFHYHPNYIGELVRDATGLPLHKYLLRLRLRRATELLALGTLAVSEIARQTGFPNAAYFTRYFRRTLGCTPSEYRRRAEL